MPLGDSFTEGGGDAGNGAPPPGAYRAPLYSLLTADGYGVQYVGDQTTNAGGGLPDNEVNHEGLGGYGVVTVQGDQNNPGVLDYLQNHDILQAYKPDAILLMIGFNNIYSPQPADIGPDATYSALRQLAIYVEQTLPGVKLIVATHAGAPGAPGNDTANGLGQLNALVPGLAAISPNISVVDGTAGFKYDGSDTGLDGLHPNVAGSAAIAAVFEKAVKAVFPSVAVPPVPSPPATGDRAPSVAPTAPPTAPPTAIDPPTSSPAAPPAAFAVQDETTGNAYSTDGQAYTGPVAGLNSDLIMATSDDINVTAGKPNVFIKTGNGEDALAVSNGTNVLDGGGGSNFLTGGTGLDTFFLDGRNASQTVWSTVVNFHAGDNVTVWGITAADFKLSWADNQGAATAKGLTGTLAGAGKSTDVITLAGFTAADLGNGKLSVGYGRTADLPGLPGSDYMSIHGN